MGLSEGRNHNLARFYSAVLVMTVKKYVNCSKISEKKSYVLLHLFTLYLNASQVAKIALNPNMVNRYCKEIQRKIAEYCKQC